jgi:hypothetical protein
VIKPIVVGVINMLEEKGSIQQRSKDRIGVHSSGLCTLYSGVES